MAEFYAAAFARQEAEREICYGETMCADGFGPLFIRQAEQLPVEEVCAACHLRSSKPEPAPPHLAAWIAFIERAEALQEAGATFPYPHTFTAQEWAALAGKMEARGKQQAREDIKRRRAHAGRALQQQSSLPGALGRPLQRLG